MIQSAPEVVGAMKVSGLFGIGEHLKRLSETGDPLEVLAKIIDFEAFRSVLDAGLGYSDGAKGGWASLLAMRRTSWTDQRISS